MRVKRDIVISDFAGDRLKETNTCRINLLGKNSHFAGAKKYAGEGFGGFFLQLLLWDLVFFHLDYER